MCSIHSRGWRRGSSSVVIISDGIDTTAEWTDAHTLARAPVQYNIRVTMGVRRTGGVRGRNLR